MISLTASSETISNKLAREEHANHDIMNVLKNPPKKRKYRNATMAREKYIAQFVLEEKRNEIACDPSLQKWDKEKYKTSNLEWSVNEIREKIASMREQVKDPVVRNRKIATLMQNPAVPFPEMCQNSFWQDEQLDKEKINAKFRTSGSPDEPVEKCISSF